MEEEKLKELQLIDTFLQKLGEGVNLSRPLNESSLNFEQLSKSSDMEGIHYSFLEMYLDKAVEAGFVKKTLSKKPDYYLTSKGFDFISSNRSLVKEFNENKKKEKKEAFYGWVNKNKVFLEVIAIIFSIASVLISYLAYKKSDEIDEFKTRVEQLEKANAKQKIESNLKLPIIK